MKNSKENILNLRGWIISIILIFSYLCANGQFYNGSQISFGKNRVQYQKFNWTYYRTDNYDVYFYPTGKMLGQYTAWKAQQYIDEIEKYLNYTATKKLQFIVYNTQSDFRESNFAYENDDFYNQGGITNIYGTKIYLYFDGNHTHFDQMLKSGIMNVYAHFVVEGEDLRANISADYLSTIPAWFYNGLSSFYGIGWNTDVEEHVKNGILTEKYSDFDELSVVDCRYAAHSFWKYIADQYGESTIPAILYATRLYRNFDRALMHVIGTSYQAALVAWYRHYFVIYKKDTKREQVSTDGELNKSKKKCQYSQLRLSPDGESYCFATNEAGRISVWLKSPDMKKPQRIFRRSHKTEDNPDLTFPLIAWHPNNETVGFTMEEKGRCYYYPYDVTTKKLGEKQLVDVEKITDFSLSADGKLMLLSAFKNGQSDIFIYSFLAKSFINITNDFYDDYAPRFINNQKQIVFSSNRPVDSLKNKELFYETLPQPHYDLFLYQYSTKNPQLLRITNTPYADETDVRPINDREIIFLSDENGITNRYLARFDSTISKIDTAIHYSYTASTNSLTDYAFGPSEQDYNAPSKRVAEIIRKDGKQNLYISPISIEKRENAPSLSSFQKKNREIAQQRDSIAKIQQEKPVRKHGFYQVRQSDVIKQTKMAKTDENSSANETNLSPSKDENLAFLQQVPRNYYVQYNINKFGAQADFGFLNQSYQQFTGGNSPIYLNTGLNGLILVQLVDLFENHRITGGFRISLDLNSNEFMMSYEDLSRRVDHQFVLYRQSIKSSIEDYLYKQRNLSAFYITKYPIDKYNSFRLTLTGRIECYAMGGLNDYSLQKKDEVHGWGAVKLEYIFASHKQLYTNLWKGSKIKLFAEYQHRIDRDNKYLFVMGFDIRKSVKVYKNMTWATRFAGSTNFGSNRLVYYMGGIDHWVGAKFNSDIWVDITKDYAYQTLATNMRGFEQNIRNGTSFLLISTELRIPFVQLIAKKRVTSGILNSLQLILFGDFGTAWTGLTPYSKDNCLYTRYIYWGSDQSNTINIKRQTEPFVGGFGLGLRMSILSYFLRLDYAWGVEDYQIYSKKGMFTLSIGTDF
ncbi:MAG: hypothetical protein MJZ76_01610 [Bacteroidales bacterium]|nr:hypothetical protein [Bacteroidales bacterium]